MWHDPTGLFAVPSIVIISQLTNPILAPGGIFNLLPNLRPTLVLAGLGNSDKNEILDAGGGPGSGGFTGKIKSSNNTITTPVAPKPPAVTARHNALDAGRGAVGNVVQRVQVTAPPATSSVAARHSAIGVSGTGVTSVQSASIRPTSPAFQNAAQNPSIGSVLTNASFTRTTSTGVHNFQSSGGSTAAMSDFRALNPTNVRVVGGGRIVGDLPGNITINIHPSGQGGGGAPTLEIYLRGTKETIKIRY